jgi:hypothetical protein
MITCSRIVADLPVFTCRASNAKAQFHLGKPSIEGFEVKWDSDDFPFGYEFS